jgi:hypothetical protein
MAELSTDIRETVRERYAKAAQEPPATTTRPSPWNP